MNPVADFGTRAGALVALVLAVAILACGRRTLATDSPVELARFTRSTNSLAFDLYARARLRPGNVAVSPLAVSNALALLRAGAHGETAVEIQRVAHAEAPADRALDTAGQVARSLGASGHKFTFRAPCRLFVERSTASDSAHLVHLGKAFGTLVEPVDFATAPEPSRRRINDWVAGQTDNHLRELGPEGSVTASTKLVVASALYFHGHWKSRFPERMTWPEGFRTTLGETKDVPTMHNTGSFRAAWADGVAVLELPYDDDELTMLIALPSGTEDLAGVEARLSPAVLDRWSLALRSESLEVAVPRFETTRHAPLGEILKALGMPLAFDPAGADFTGIAGKGVYLTELFHEVYLKVDEAGTQAAAATWGGFAKAAPPRFDVDHPFVFFIREPRSGLILFMGRISDPTAP